jgi:lipopolysaccharide/colanic/teichoic acid biosynthesis glycosyltransferase
VDLYTDSQKAILCVRPGITDWASIKFRDEGEIVVKSGYADPDQAYLELIRPEKLRLQLRYVHERNFWVDLKILLQTVATLVRAQATG